MKKSYFLLVALCAVCACGRVEKRYIVSVQPAKLTKDNIYNPEVVSNVLFDSQELDIDSIRNESRKLFLKGIDLYRNKKDIIMAIGMFKRSLLIYPDAKTYYELGNALIDAHQGSSFNKEAINAYGVAVALKFQPVANVHYKIALAESLMDASSENAEVILYDLRKAFLNGFSDTNLLKQAPSLRPLLETPAYKRMLANVSIAKHMDNANALFALYISSFPDLHGNFEVGRDDVEMKHYRNSSIDYEFAPFVPEMENVGFGRDVSHDFYIVGKVAETPDYTAVIYSSVGFDGESMQQVFTRLVTYNKQGDIIASKVLSSQVSAEKIRSGKFSAGEITIQDDKRIWEKPIDKVSFEENTVKGYDLVANATFQLQPDGKIETKQASKNFRDIASGVTIKQ